MDRQRSCGEEGIEEEMKTFKRRVNYVRAEQWFGVGDVPEAPINTDVLQMKKGIVVLRSGDWIVRSDYPDRWFVMSDREFRRRYEEGFSTFSLPRMSE